MRLSEALQGTWSQIDRRSRVWRVPASNSKSKRIRSIPLNPSALEVLDLLGTEGKSEHLFINPANGRATDVCESGMEQAEGQGGVAASPPT